MKTLRRWLTGLLLRPASPRERAEIMADLRELREHRGRGKGPAWKALWLAWKLVGYAWALRVTSPGRGVGGGEAIGAADHTGSGASGRGAGGRSAAGSAASGAGPWWRGTSWTGASAGRGGGTPELVRSVGSDVRQTIRGLVRSPAVALVAVPTMALAIGATTSIFSFADALVLRPLSVREPDRLISLVHVTTEEPRSYSSFSFPDYLDLRERAPLLEGVAAWATVDVRIGEGAASEEVEGQIVSGNYFDVLGVEPILGRTFLPEEDRTPGTRPVVVIGDGLWRNRFGGDASAVGARLVLNGRPFTVVGVVPAAASAIGLEAAPRVWAPLMMHEAVIPGFRAFGIELFGNRGTHWLEVLARLEDGADRAVAAEALRAVARGQADENPETNAGWSIEVMDPREARAGTPGSRPLVGLTGLLAAVVVMVLLIACANVANLLLARAAARRREMGVRRAIGAGRSRLVRQVLTEAVTLSLVGGGAGVLLAGGLMRVLPSLGPAANLPGLDVRLDPRVLGFALALSLLTGIVFGLVPALRASAVDVARSTGETGPAGGGGGRGGGRLGQVLVAVQVALSLVLLVGAGLTLRTLWNLRSVELGFDANDVWIARVDLSDGGYEQERELGLFRRLLEDVRATPGVRSAALARIPPFSSSRMANDIFWEDADSAGSRGRTNVDMNVVSPGYFATMGIPVLRGRPFIAEDRGGAPDVAVVNEALAERLWPGEDPVGRRVWSWSPDGPDRALDVVGVVANGRYYRSWLTEDRPFLFVPSGQHPSRAMVLHVRGSAPGAPPPEALRRAVTELDPAVPAPRVETVDGARDAAVGLQRTSARLLALFGALATFIAAVGIYGVVSFAVRRRTHEIGVRMALGARPWEVRRLVILGSARPVLAGTAVGWMAAWGLGGLVSALLYGVEPHDPMTFTTVALTLTAVGLLASWIPATRATRVDPLGALRD